jgi:hypothetical protein
MDLSARLTGTFVATAVISALLLLPSWWAIPIAVALLLLAWASYRAAISTAGAYRHLINAAVALHRSAPLNALHLPLPTTPTAERDLGRRQVVGSLQVGGWERLVVRCHLRADPHHPLP